MKLIDAIFCDDIRQEVNGKLSLMGLYNDGIMLQITDAAQVKWPIPMNLATLFRFNLSKEESQPDNFVFEYILNDKTIVNIKGKMNHPNDNPTILNLALNGVSIPIEPGNLGFLINIYAGETLILSEKNIEAIKIITQ